MSDMNKISDQELESVSGGVTEDQALQTALEHAGVRNPRDLRRKRIELDFDNGFKVYEIKFKYHGMEYEYDINAEDGRILKFEKDWD